VSFGFGELGKLDEICELCEVEKIVMLHTCVFVMSFVSFVGSVC